MLSAAVTTLVLASDEDSCYGTDDGSGAGVALTLLPLAVSEADVFCNVVVAVAVADPPVAFPF